MSVTSKDLLNLLYYKKLPKIYRDEWVHFRARRPVPASPFLLSQVGPAPTTQGLLQKL